VEMKPHSANAFAAEQDSRDCELLSLNIAGKQTQGLWNAYLAT